MAYLLDTNALIWSLTDRKKLKPEIIEILADSSNDVSVSFISLWEITIKQSYGKLYVSDKLVKDIEEVGYNIINPNVSYLEDYSKLPFHHRDPFDRMLIATARCENMKIITADRIFSSYDVRVIEAI